MGDTQGPHRGPDHQKPGRRRNYVSVCFSLPWRQVLQNKGPVATLLNPHCTDESQEVKHFLATTDRHVELVSSFSSLTVSAQPGVDAQAKKQRLNIIGELFAA